MVTKKQLNIAPNHILVPKHEIITLEEAKQVLEKYHCKAIELPLIFGSDPAIVGLGVKPGDMIRITRTSATAGESFYYRYVVEV